MKNDFHMHTIHSDGKHTVQSIFESAKKYGLKYMAITDHNINTGVIEAREFDYPKKYSIKLINGIEMNVTYKNYFIEVLILGYNLEKANKLGVFNRERLDIINNGIIDDLIIIANEKKLYFRQEDIKRNGIAFGQIEFINTLKSYKENAEFFSKAGKISVKDASKNNPFWIDCTKFYFSLQEINKIRDLIGGKIFIPHPLNRFKIKNQKKFVNDVAKSKLIDGLEVYHPDISLKESEYLIKVANRYNLLKTGGSDNHEIKYPLGVCAKHKVVIPKMQDVINLYKGQF